MANRDSMSERDMAADPQPDTPGEVPVQYLFSLAGAAAACGVARSTIRRRLDKGDFPNARRVSVPGEPETTAAWRIPAADLVAAGLPPNRPDPGSDHGEDTPGAQGGDGGSAALSDMAGGQAAELDALRARLDDLERLVDAERRRGDDMARMAEQAQRSLDLALRRLGPGDSEPEGPQEPAGAATAAPEGDKGPTPSPGFWGRLFGAGGG